MSDLNDRALAVRALREAAPAAPWRCHGQDHSICVIGGKGQFPLFRIDSGGRAAMEFAAKAHDMADLIRDQDAKITALLAENDRLRGIKPQMGERAPHGNGREYQHDGLPRYGIRWNGPTEPLAVPMDDGYWTPFHLALAVVKQLAEAISKLDARPAGPDRCPFTGREFWGNIEHPELGEVATYGGPFDTYTLPARTDADPDYCVRRFDHDRGHWLLDDVEYIGMQLVDDQLYTSEEDPAELRARAEVAEARYKALCEAEPVAKVVVWTDPANGGTSRRKLMWGADPLEAWMQPDAREYALIHRPSMEGDK